VLKDNLSKDFHDYGMWWTPDEIVIEIDGEPVAAIVTYGCVTGELETRFSTGFGCVLPARFPRTPPATTWS
jgi:hypothetical protein